MNKSGSPTTGGGKSIGSGQRITVVPHTLRVRTPAAIFVSFLIMALSKQCILGVHDWEEEEQVSTWTDRSGGRDGRHGGGRPRGCAGGSPSPEGEWPDYEQIRPSGAWQDRQTVMTSATWPALFVVGPPPT